MVERGSVKLPLSPLKEDKRLKKYYDNFNRIFFDGKLPRDTRVGWNSEILGYAYTVGIEDTETKHKFFLIYLDKKKHFDTKQVLLTLLHEMAHIHLYPDMKHGKKFDREIIRLAVRGAFKGLI